MQERPLHPMVVGTATGGCPLMLVRVQPSEFLGHGVQVFTPGIGNGSPSRMP